MITVGASIVKNINKGSFDPQGIQLIRLLVGADPLSIDLKEVRDFFMIFFRDLTKFLSEDEKEMTKSSDMGITVIRQDNQPALAIIITDNIENTFEEATSFLYGNSFDDIVDSFNMARANVIDFSDLKIGIVELNEDKSFEHEGYVIIQ